MEKINRTCTGQENTNAGHFVVQRVDLIIAEHVFLAARAAQSSRRAREHFVPVPNKPVVYVDVKQH